MYKSIVTDYYFKRFRGLEYWIVFFLIIILTTIIVRGIGFEFFGGGKSGGMFYIKVISISLLALFLFITNTTTKYWKYFFAAYCLSSLLPVFSDLIFLFYGKETWINYLIQGSTTIEQNFDLIGEGSNIFRIQSAAPAAEMLFFFTLVNYPFINYKSLQLSFTYKNVLLLAVVIILAGVSGHRLSFVYIFLYTLFFVYYAGNKHFLQFVFRIFLLAVMVAAVIIYFYNDLSPAFQRSFSFLPFINNDDVVLRDATASTNFRFILWGLSILQLPQYLLIGKGFAFTNYDISYSDYAGTLAKFLDIGVLHNGLLGLLYNLGIAGLISGMAIFFKSIRRFGKKIKDMDLANWNNRYFIFLKVHLVVSVMGYILFYGDVQTNFSDILLIIINLKLFQHFYQGSVAVNKNYQVESIN